MGPEEPVCRVQSVEKRWDSLAGLRAREEWTRQVFIQSAGFVIIFSAESLRKHPGDLARSIWFDCARNSLVLADLEQRLWNRRVREMWGCLIRVSLVLLTKYGNPGCLSLMRLRSWNFCDSRLLWFEIGDCAYLLA